MDNDIKELTSHEALMELCHYFLGEDFYVVDPIHGTQVNAVIVDTIKENYKGIESRMKSPIDKVKEILGW